MELFKIVAEELGFFVKVVKMPHVNGEMEEHVYFSRGDSGGIAFKKKDLDAMMTEEDIRDFIKIQVVPIFSTFPTIYTSEYLVEKVKTGDILLCLINKEKNEEVLKDVPYRDFLDLAIVYRMVVDAPENSDERECTVLLNNDVISKVGVTEAELFERGMDFLRKNVKVITAAQLVEKTTGIPCMEPCLCNMSIYSTGKVHGGAATMLLLPEIENCGYILPSSVHNVRLIHDDENVEVLARMVEDINRCEVAPEERLSNSVYRIKEGKLEIAFRKSL